jgi:hypothetical protein
LDLDPDGSAYPFGSSLDDRNFARHNAVVQNQIFKRSVENAIISSTSEVDAPNYILFNDTVNERIIRRTGCYIWHDQLPEGTEGRFILDGAAIALLSNETTATYRCQDGQLLPV